MNLSITFKLPKYLYGIIGEGESATNFIFGYKKNKKITFFLYPILIQIRKGSSKKKITFGSVRVTEQGGDGVKLHIDHIVPFSI